MNEPATTFAWCFSHGRLHHFNGEPWCTATWAVLPGSTEEQAMVAKEERYGNAEFLHQLPDDQQIALIDVHRSTSEAAANAIDSGLDTLFRRLGPPPTEADDILDRLVAESDASVAALGQVLDVEAGLADILNRDTEPKEK